jgi:hypothetical protein
MVSNLLGAAGQKAKQVTSGNDSLLFSAVMRTQEKPSIHRVQASGPAGEKFEPMDEPPQELDFLVDFEFTGRVVPLDREGCSVDYAIYKDSTGRKIGLSGTALAIAEAEARSSEWSAHRRIDELEKNKEKRGRPEEQFRKMIQQHEKIIDTRKNDQQKANAGLAAIAQSDKEHTEKLNRLLKDGSLPDKLDLPPRCSQGPEG